MGLARGSLFLALVALELTGCLDTPPEYSVPDPVPPVLTTNLIDPTTAETTYWSTDIIPFTIYFRSDDEGEGLSAYFVWDRPSGPAEFSHIADQILVDPDPRPFEQQIDRQPIHFTWNWQRNVKPGCHVLTMILSHRSNFKPGYDVYDPLAAAETSWFLGLGDAGKTCGETPTATSP